MKAGEPERERGRGPGPAGRLYGREPEEALLVSVLDGVAGGRPRSLSVEGAAGTGKSALLARARAHAGRRGWTVLSGRATILETANGFGVLRQVLSGLAALPDGRPATALVPAGADAAPFEVFETVSDHLRAAAAGAPVLITLDDLQWCDSLTLRWLAYLAHRGADPPVALLPARTLGEAGGHGLLVDELVASSERRTLHRLTPAQTGQWAADVMGVPCEDAFAEACHRATGGNPALLSALLPALAARSVPPAGVPAAIESVGAAAVRPRVLPWITRGGPEAWAVAQAAVVLGDDSEPVPIARLAAVGLDDAGRAVDRLIKLGVLSDGTPLRYTQPLVRAVVAAGIRTGRRTAQRLRAARVVREHYADPERAAAHLMRIDVAGEPWVPETLRAAARSALERGRAGRAVEHLRRALAEPMPAPARAELLAGIGAAEVAAGVPGAEDTFLAALGMTADPSLRARIGVDLACVHAIAGRPLTAALKIIDEACAELPPERAEVAAEAELGVFIAHAATADAGEYCARLPRLRELTAGDDRLRALAGVADAWSDIWGGRDRAECVRRTRAALAVIDHRRTWESRLRLLTVGALISADEYDLADDPGEIGGSFAHLLGGVSEAAVGACLRGCVLHGQGDLEAARKELATALENPFVAAATGVERLVRVLIDLGDLDAADELLRESGPASRPVAAWAATMSTFAKASLCLARDQYEEALQGFLETGESLRALGVENPALCAWRSQAARCHSALGDIEAAKALATEEVRLARCWGAPRALSVALAAAGAVNADLDAAREAIAVLDPLDADLHRAQALVDLGSALQDTGATDEALEHLQDGFALAHMVGARPVWLRAARRIKSAGGKPDLGRISGVSALTAQERAVAERAAAGSTNRQIADEMVLTQRTVEQYLTGAYRKLGITGRRQLAAALSG
ncbi:AAA family ATPase [Actinomadura welshii]